MRRGTRVGQAYVSITADGSDINEEIVDSVDEAGKDIDKKGDEHGERYGEHFGDSLRVEFSHAGDRAGEELARRLADSGDDAGDKFGDRLGKRLDSNGERIGHSAGRQIASGLNDELEISIGRMIDLLESRLVTAVSGNRGGGGVGGTGGTATGDAANKQTLYKSFDFYTMFEAARVKLHEQSNAAIEADDMKLRKSQQALYDRLAKEAERRDINLWKQRNAIARINAKVQREIEQGIIDERGNTIRRGGTTRALSDRIGAIFGAGSRNNALNLFGKSLGGIVGLVGKISSSATSMFSIFKKGFTEAEEGASLFTKLGSGFSGVGGALGSGLSSLAASGPAAAAAIVAVAVAMTLLISVMNALLAIVVALAATIASALVGALAVAGGAILAVVAAGGLLTAAFMSMTDAQQHALKSAFTPIKKEMVGIAQIMLHDMVPAFAVWSTHLQKALALLAPVAAVMGKAFAKAGSLFTAALSGPGFQMFADTLGKTLPGIVINLTKALGGFLNGTLGVFSAIMPFVRQFAIYLGDVATRFANWATSAQGQNAISDFVDRALGSLRSLWSFLGAVGGLLSEVLFGTAGQEAGNSIFDSMTDAVKRFTDFLRANPDAVSKWFQQGVTFAEALGETIVTLTQVLQGLNQSGVIDGIGHLADAAADGYYWFSKLPRVVQNLIFPLQGVSDLIGLFAGNARLMAAGVIFAFAGIANGIEGFLRGTAAAVGALARVPVIGDKFKGASKNINQAADNVARFGDNLNHLARNIVINVNADTTPAADALNRLVRQVRGLHINIPVTASTNATIGEAAAISGNHPGGSSGSVDTSSLIQSGGNALSNTSTDSGGYKGPKKYHNPYVAFANKLIKDGPSIAAQVRNAILTVNRQVKAAISDAARSQDLASLQNNLSDTRSSITTAAAETVNTAQQALNSAAQTLASATSAKAAKRALKEVRQSQRDLQAALKNQRRIQAAARIIAQQEVTNPARVAALLSGFKVVNATLADYASARAQIADRLSDANQKLTDALSLRDQYKTAVTDSINSFAALTTASAKTIDGVTQALTATDITSNLQDRLTQIQTFQHNLQLLLAQGLSDAAYKQIVDAGVESGGAYATALVQGGTGAIQQVNSLVDQINGVASTLGTEASDRLYQAGVSAAQGLVDGLTSLSAQLDAAATALGNSIAAAIAKALGIHSPSTVLRDMMDNVGDGAVVGLDNQHTKVGRAASRFSDAISVSPEVAAYERQQRSASSQQPVSGNQSDPRFRDLVVHTPTEDPQAVAYEVLNEVTGRL